MAPLKTGLTPAQIFKHPVTYALIVVVSVFSGVLTWVTTQSDKTNDKCWEQVSKLQQEKDELTTALLVKNGIIGEIKKKADSLATKEEKQ